MFMNKQGNTANYLPTAAPGFLAVADDLSTLEIPGLGKQALIIFGVLLRTRGKPIVLNLYPLYSSDPEHSDYEQLLRSQTLIEHEMADWMARLLVKPWLCMEFKKLGGDVPYKALHHLVTAVKGKLKEGRVADVLTIYLVGVGRFKFPHPFTRTGGNRRESLFPPACPIFSSLVPSCLRRFIHLCSLRAPQVIAC